MSVSMTIVTEDHMPFHIAATERITAVTCQLLPCHVFALRSGHHELCTRGYAVHPSGTNSPGDLE